MRNALIVIAVLLPLVACGSADDAMPTLSTDPDCVNNNTVTIEYWHEMPATVVALDGLQSDALDAIDAINTAVGIGALTYTEDGLISVQCGKIAPHAGTSLNSFGLYQGIISSEILIDCDLDPSKIAKVIAHELWHSLGFRKHYCDFSCLNSYPLNDFMELEELFCSEMLDDFNAVYGP